MTVIRIILPILWIATALAEAEPPAVSRVVIVGLDGVSATGIVAAETPHMDRLMREGASTHAMRAVMPTASLPNWASFLMGAGPEQHGVTDNAWLPDRHALSPGVVGPGGSLPTIFSLIRHHRPDLKTAAYLDWEPISRFLEPCGVDVLFVPRTDKSTSENRLRRAEETMSRLIEGLRNDEARFAFIQLDSPDHFGHKFRWESPEYLESIAHIDGEVGKLLAALDDTGLAGETLLLVVSDHGGVGTRHGGASDAEVLVPWIIRGPGVRPGMDLGPFAKVEDTAPTVATALGARQPAAWTGRPLLSAFEWHPVPELAGAAAATVAVTAGDMVEVRVSATAPDGAALELLIDWGDGTPMIWSPPVASGETRVFKHRYQRAGTHTALARAAAGPETISNAIPVGVFAVSPDLSSGSTIRSHIDGALFHDHSPQSADSHWALGRAGDPVFPRSFTKQP